MQKLTTTSYALLALLARHPWTAYEITQYMKTSPLRRVWPRAESRLYLEPKKLTEYKYATAEVNYTGKRKRTVYQITKAGQQALQDWLVSPSATHNYESELLVKLLCGDHSNRKQVGRWLQEMKQHALAEAENIASTMGEVQTQGFSMPEMAEFNVWVVRFMVNDIESRLRWVDLMSKRIDQLAEEAPGGNLSAAESAYRVEITRLKKIIKQHAV